MATTHEKRRAFVNKEYGDMTRGKSLTNAQKTRIFKKLWRQAKRQIK
jgi:hypothetical protein